MSVEIHDAYGSLGQVATTSGFAAMRDWLTEKSIPARQLKALNEFFVKGMTEDTEVCADQALYVATLIDDNQVRSTFIGLAHMLKEAKNFAVVQ